MFLAVLSLVIVLVLIFDRNRDKKLKQIPGPSIFYLIYIVITCRGSAEKILSRLHEEFGSVFKIQIKPFKPLILASNVECVEKIIASKDNAEKIYISRLFEPYLGQGLATIRSVNQWKIERRIINQALGQHFLQQFLSKSERYVERLSEVVEQEFINKPIDIQLYTRKTLLDVILGSISEPSIHHDEKDVTDYMKARDRFFDLLFERLATVYLHPHFLHKFSKNYRETQEACSILKAFAKDLIDRHKSIPDDLKDKGNFVQIMIAGGMSEQAMIDNINTIVEGGHDTTALTTSWIVYELSRRQHLQDDLLKETIDIMGSDRKAEITLKHTQEMKYIESFVSEILRYYTIFGHIARKVGKTVNINGAEIPEGSAIIILGHFVHMSTEYYENPTEFDPKRFLPENKNKINPNAYLPFSAGLRMCAGKTMAMHQLKLITAKLVRTFEIRSCGHVADIVEIPFRSSRNGVFVHLINRNRLNSKIYKEL